MNQAYDRAVDVVRAVYDRRLSGPPVLDPARDFPGGAAFLEAWPALRAEAMAIKARIEDVPRFHEIMPEQASISANDGRDWRMYILKAYGIAQPAHLAACPCFAGLLRGRPEILSASFSFLGPRKHIPPHRGPMRGILRFYQMLSMPRDAAGAPAAALRVDGTEYRLEEGEFLLWDDTFEHEAWNDSDEVRIVLSLDVWRPNMPVDMQLLSATLIQLVRFGIRVRGIG
jgi:aspartate beta-hydroxylase